MKRKTNLYHTKHYHNQQCPSYDDDDNDDDDDDDNDKKMC